MKTAFNAFLHHNGSHSEIFTHRLASLAAVMRALWFADAADRLTFIGIVFAPYVNTKKSTSSAKWLFLVI